MKTVIVTGGAGFIGSNLIRALLEKEYRVVCVDNFDDLYDPALKEENISNFLKNERFILYRIDIRNLTQFTEVFTKEKPHLVVHLAARPDTRDAVKSPNIYVSVNIEGSLNVLQLCKEFGVENLVIGSSSSVYGNSPHTPWKETEAADNPLSPYGATKRAVEVLSFSYYHNFGIPITNLRYFNAYGEGIRPTLVPYLWGKAILSGDEIEISGDGSRSRDYTYIGDVVDATIRALEKPLGFEVINVGNSKPHSLKELLTVFEDVIGVKAQVKSRPSHHASAECTCADISRAKELLGWEPKTSLREGVEKLVSWIRDHRIKKSL